MGIPLWESPPDAKALDKSSATNRCDVHSAAHTSSGTSTRLPTTPGPPAASGRNNGNLPYDYIYSGSRPIRRHILDSASDTIEIEDLQNEREHETQIRERERERELSARMERSRRERGERRSAHMERFLNANYHTPQLPTTSTTSQRPRPHMIQPSSDQLLTLSEFLRESSPSQSRNSNSNSNSANNGQTPPTSETPAFQQLLGMRVSTGNRNNGERRDVQTWERALSATGMPLPLNPATTAVSTSNAAATISNPPPAQRRSASVSTDWPPSSPAAATAMSPSGQAPESFQALVSQIHRIGTLQDFMLNSVDETAASLEESLSIHSHALNRALTPASQALMGASLSTAISSSSTGPDISSQNYYTSLRVREARIRTMQSRIDLLASEFALLRSTRRELRRAESEALSMFQLTGAIPPPPAATPATTTNGTGSAIGTPTAATTPPGPHEAQIRTEVDEVDEALDAEGNSSRRVLRSTFLPSDIGDEAVFRHFANAENRARVRERLAGVRRELEAEQARSTEVIQEQRRRMAEALAGGLNSNTAANRAGNEDDEEGSGGSSSGSSRRRGRYTASGNLERSQSERRA
ncbi:hypothetical protein DRE_00350 [Drechslerella stenobrocha 248]|uniref:Uncharacterized protein n=1 Tax=Drechslerella stenobrocha 248 TaxID=1043628 RepID=W7I4K1_9PEZI|nr:hypothetical protein DRE_00350 [Drechslerella stenobrocha 248]